jgi:large subunit ribosomal protein L25
MAEITLQANTGRTTGSRPSGRLRAEGKVPGVIYGLGQDPMSVSVAWRELRVVLTGEAGLNALIDLHVDGAAGDLVMVKDLQRHPVRRDVLHVDFLRVSRDHVISVEVPIILEGEATKVTSNDGVVDHVLYALTISAKPADIPNEIGIDISGLEIGDAIRVGDVVLPAGVTTDVDPEDAIVMASVAQDTSVEPAEGEAGEGAEGAEGEAGEGGESAAQGEGGGGDGADAAPSEDS